MKTKTALVTGCTSGIGLYLAREFARNRHDVILVAAVEHDLQVVAHELEAAYGVGTLVVAVDLEKDGSARQIRAAIEDSGVAVDILVNHASRGFRGKFQEIPVEKDTSMIDLNIGAMLRLTKQLLPSMISRGYGKILNTASVSGFEPGPLMAVHQASRAFILSFSEALSLELNQTGVTVTVLCPGATDTDFFPNAQSSAEICNPSDFQRENTMAPEEVAKAAYKGLMNDDLIVIPEAPEKSSIPNRRKFPERSKIRNSGNKNHSVARQR